MIEHPILYSFRRCPFAIRARCALAYSRIGYYHREILLKERPSKLFELSSKGTVPILELKEGIILDESIDIMIWAISFRDDLGWFENNKSSQLEMIKINDNDFKYWLDKYKYHSRHPEKSKEYYRGKCSVIIDKYENIFKGSKFLFGEKCSLSDVAIFPFIRQFSFVNKIWFQGSFKRTNQWLNFFIESDEFNFIMKKYYVWNPLNNEDSFVNFF